MPVAGLLAALAVVLGLAAAGSLAAAPAGAAEGAAPAPPQAQDAASQTSGATTADGAATAKAIQDLVDAARKGGATVLVIAPPGAAAPAQPDGEAPPSFVRMLHHLRQQIANIVDNVPRHIAALPQTIAAARDSGALDQLHHTLLVALAANFSGFAAWLAWRRYGNARIERLRFAAAPRDRADRLAFLLVRAAGMTVGVVVFCTAAATVVVAMSRDIPTTRKIFEVFQLPIAAILLTRVLAFLAFAPGSPTYRLPPLDDATAWRVTSMSMAAAIWAGVFGGLATWMDWVEAPSSVIRLTAIVAVLGTGVISAAMLVALKRGLRAGAVDSFAEEYAIPARLLLARTWHYLLIGGLCVAMTLAIVRILLRHYHPIGPILGPFIVVVAALIVHAILLLLIDLTLKVPAPRPDAAASPPPAAPPDGERKPSAAASGEAGAATLDPAAEAALAARVSDTVLAERASILHGLAEHGALILVAAGAIVAILWTWGIDVLDPEGIVARGIGFFLVVFVASMGYRAVKLWLDREIAVEWMAANEEEAHGATASTIGANTRLGTLLTIVRNFLLFAIIGLALMMALSSLGVPITPLFAGAGVVGLAIGFGAQSLIKDMFSGMFYLIDDAFRTGEYIDIGVAKGTVEKISIRSFQLRHQNGPLNTVPFGEIKRLTNYSRDWVIVKLPIRVTYDTPVPRLNQIIKKLSKELLADEDVGPLFLEPLKSQGVYEMEDSAMVIRVKFMTRPNDQFVVKRIVYSKIRETFEREGVHFAHRNVTVYIGNAAELTGAAAAAGSRGTATVAAAAAAAAAAAPSFDEDDLASLDATPGDDDE